MSVLAYYTKLKGMWDELSSYSKVPSCTFRFAQVFCKEREEQKVFQFLIGLADAVFGTTRSQILGMDPLPTMSKAYVMVTKEERHREVARGQEERSEQVVFAMQAGGKGKGPYVGERKNPIEKPPYSHCQKTNHDVTTCFELIGYPSWHPGSKRDF